MKVRALLLSMVAVGCPLAAWAQKVPQYAIVDSVRVARIAQGKGDHYAIDPNTHRLYGVGQYIFDLNRRTVVDSFADSTAGEGFVLVGRIGRGLTATGLLFDSHTARSIAQLPFSGDGSAYDPVTDRAFLFNEYSTAVEMKSGQVVGHPVVPGALESAVGDGHGRIFENIATTGSIAVIDAKSLQVVATYSLAPGKSPKALAIDAAHGRLFAGCDSLLVIVDANNGRIVSTLHMNGQSDQNAFDPTTQLLFMPNGKGKGLTIVHEDGPDAFTVVQTLDDPRLSSQHVVLDPSTHHILVPHRFADQTLGFVVLGPGVTVSRTGGS